MCGIYVTNIQIEEEVVKKRLESIKYRGPDNTSVKRIDDLILGHLRLSILDLDKRSNQPLQRDNLHIVFNGEIYNFQQLKLTLEENGHNFTSTSDTEVLLAGYRQWGEDVVTRLNGMFAFCIYDQEKQILFGARDRLGVKPFYYSWNNEGFEICSQLKPINQNKTISESALSIYYDCGYIPSPYSIYENVFKLSPGSCITIDLKQKSKIIRSYWDLQKIKIKKISYNNAKDKLHELLKDAVKIRLQSDVSIGTFLSGGIDSALITSIASKVSNKQVKTFSIGFEDHNYDESKTAATISKIIGSKHKTTICTLQEIMEQIPKLIEVYDEPFADSSALPSLLLNKTTKPYITVALSGDGGDESFLGYNHFEWVQFSSLFFKIQLAVREFLSHLLFPIPGIVKKKRLQFFRKIFRFKTNHEFIKAIFTGFDSLQKKETGVWYKTNYQKYQQLSKNPIQEAADINIKLWLENDSNVKVDRASMAYSVEVRSPFLDYRVIEFARSIPVNYRYVRNRRKRILRDILIEYIPEKIFNQPKKGFSVPIKHWMRKELKDEFMSHLTDEFLEKLPNFKIIEFKKMLDLHMKGEEDYGYYIWRIYILSKWWNEYVK